MQEKYLPIGSVVLLKGGKKRLMITGYCMQTQEKPGVIYDYSGCIFPEGVIRSDITSVFNHDQIVRIDFTGFSDDEGKKFLEKHFKLQGKYLYRASHGIDNSKVEIHETKNPSISISETLPYNYTSFSIIIQLLLA